MQPRYLTALVYSIVFHAVLLGGLAFSAVWRPASHPPPPVLAIQAAVVDESMIAAELAKLEEADQRIRDAEAQRVRELDEQAKRAKAEREKEEQRLAQLAREREAAEIRNRELAQKRETETKERQAREQQEAEQRRAQAEVEEQRLAELEQQRIKEEQRLAAIAEQQRKDEAARRKADREAALQADREEQLRRAVAEESARREAEEAGLLDEYLIQIAQRIERNWIRPASAQVGLKCELLLTQIPGGEVIDVQIISCNGDAVVERSIEAAVKKASPLPLPRDPRLFERKVRVFFEPDN